MGFFSVGNIVKIGGVLIAGLLGYTLIKNAGSIGSSIGSFVGTGLGQGVSSLGEGLSLGMSTNLGGLADSWNDAINSINIFGGNVNSDTAGALSVGDPNVNVDPSPQPAPHIPISEGFKGFVASGTVSEDFAQEYSFQPPPKGTQLDVSKTFAYISSPTYRNNQELSNLSSGGGGHSSPFGGYGSSQAQTNALASAIADSAQRFPSWFS